MAGKPELRPKHVQPDHTGEVQENLSPPGPDAAASSRKQSSAGLGSSPAEALSASNHSFPTTGRDSFTVPGLPGEPSAAAAVEDWDISDEVDAQTPSYEEFIETYAAVPDVREGVICRGKVVSVSPEAVIVDIGGKTEGIAPASDFLDGLPVQPGEEIDVLVEKLGAPGDYAILSHQRARLSRAWEEVERAHAHETALTARVLQRVKGGLMVHIGVPAFLPGSQADIRPVPDLDSFLGQQFPVRVLKLAKARGNVVVSRRILLEEELAHLKSQTLSQLAEGAIVTGRVKNVTEYGAFVDLGGIDGLIHVTDVSWSRIKSPTDILTPGAEIAAKVLKFDAEKERVSLSLKHLRPDPWENLPQRYREGERVRGRVVSITDYGAFAEIEPGVEGLIHVSAMTWSKRLKHPSKYVEAGQEIEAIVLNIKPEERRISLSLKHLAADPWTTVIERYKLGSVVQGRVRNLTSYGAFIELEEGVDGLVHVSDLSWSSRVKHPKDVLKKGQQTQAAVLHVDLENRRLSLGLKQLQPDVWETFLSMHREGDVLEGYVTRQAKFGVFVELVAGVEGLCHNSEMAANSHGGKKSPLQVGEKYEFRIIRLDEYDRRIGLSRRALERDGNAKEQEQPTVTVPSASPAEKLTHLAESTE